MATIKDESPLCEQVNDEPCDTFDKKPSKDEFNNSKSEINKSAKNKKKGKTKRISDSGDNKSCEHVTKAIEEVVYENIDNSAIGSNISEFNPTLPKPESAVKAVKAPKSETNETTAAVFSKNDGSSDIVKREDENDDDGDPIMSGTGIVSKDCSASDLNGWSEILPKWHSELNQRPKGLEPLVRGGIPDPLRGEVWQLVSGAQLCSNLMDQYPMLLTRSAPTEQIILRDVHRTYPAHENFRTNSGSNSLLDSLFKVCKAYAVYDEEVGYCQGLSFLVAALLLHMPEEQAFCVFARIMQHYGLRDLFRNNFDELYLKFYQLERLLEDNMPDLYQHFSLIGIEPFTYASQWFLTVFTAKFPLNAVFCILDVFLLDGMNTIFQIALSLLQSSKQELLNSDFEGVLKYFRVQMPKRYRNQENVQQLIAASSAISLKKLSKHAKSYEIMKQKERLLENPISRLERENAKLTENNLRLEQENDDLARDLVASKIQLRAQLDVLEDEMETLNRSLTYSRQDCQSYLNTISDMEDERSRLEVEVSQLKEVCRRELHRAESELARDNSIISDYKKICSQMSKRLDYRLKCAVDFITIVGESLRDNEFCAERKCYATFQDSAQDFLDKIKSDDKIDLDDSALSGSKSPRKQQLLAKESLERQITSESDYANRPVGALVKSALLDSKSTSSEIKIKQLTDHIDELEVELARTKLALVEAECKCQQLTHDLNAGVTVKVPASAKTDASKQSHQSGNSLTKKLDFMRAKKSFTRQPIQTSPAANNSGNVGGAFSKLNNLISERISNISQNYQYYPTSPAATATCSNKTLIIGGGDAALLPVSSSSPSLVGLANGTKSSKEGLQAADEANKIGANNNTMATIRDATILEHKQNQC